MKLPITLSSYIARNFFFQLIIILCIFSVLISLIDSVELLRKLADKNIPTHVLIRMIFYKLPSLIITILPFIVLITSALTFTNLARRSELIVIRSSGISAIEFIIPAIVVSILFGVLVTTVLNPISCTLLSAHEYLQSKYINPNKKSVKVSDQGMWIKHEIKKSDKENYDMSDANISEFIIHANEVNESDEKHITLKDNFVIAFDAENSFIFRADSDVAVLKNGYWNFKDAIITTKNGEIKKEDNYKIPTNFVKEDVEKSFSDPETISFWELPQFIEMLKKSGFSPTSHILQWNKILSSSLFYASMVLIGAVFSLKSPRQGKLGLSIIISLGFGFVIYFLSNLIYSLGLSGSLPVIVAVWSPVAITFLTGFVYLLHYEEGI